MKLYHGTSLRFKSSILQCGIKPRGDGGSNWDMHPSKSDLVYLTVAYPFYFAICTAKDDESLVVFEIDSEKLDESLFLPDEDFISQTIAHQTNQPLEEVHSEVVECLENWQDCWKKSLEGLGNCAYQGIIPCEAITRYCVFDGKEHYSLRMMMADPSISIFNYFFVGKRKYVPLVEWMFGDREQIPNEFEGLGLEINAMMQDQINYWQEESKNRQGITVCTV